MEQNDYMSLGYDNFLTKVPENMNGLSTLAFDVFTDDISGNKVQGGIMQTNDGNTQLNLEQGFFRVIEGDTEFVRLGRQEDGTVGFITKDQDGSTLIKFAGEESLLSSPNEDVVLNFVTGQFEVKDDQGRTIILMGRQEGGF